MNVSLSTDALTKTKADLLAIGIGEGGVEASDAVKALDQAMGGRLLPLLALDEFTGKKGQTYKVAASGLGAAHLLLVSTVGETPRLAARMLGVQAARAARGYDSLAVLLPGADAEATRELSTGVVTGAYRYTRYLTGDRIPKRSLSKVKLLVEKKVAALTNALKDGVALGEAVNTVRDLVNDPPNDQTPTVLADFAVAAGKRHGVQSKVWNKKGLEKERMQLFLAVNRGSAEEPRMVHMVYKPKGKKKAPKVAFVGKGLTFDAGGLCIKPPKSMLDMKCDMAGAATTIGIVVAAARLGLPVEVHGLIGCTENMLGAAAYRPGDVFLSREGKSVEIINTDAEGRLVLADVLSYAKELKADFLIDHATLTGACMVALGSYRAGLFSDDEELRSRYLAAAEEEGERYWQLPLDKDLKDSLKSPMADLKHTGDRMGGSITAALFLQEFVGDSRWMHLDIAGPAFLEGGHGEAPRGGTGFGVLTAIRFLEGLAQGPAKSSAK